MWEPQLYCLHTVYQVIKGSMRADPSTSTMHITPCSARGMLRNRRRRHLRQMKEGDLQDLFIVPRNPGAPNRANPSKSKLRKLKETYVKQVCFVIVSALDGG